MNKYFHDFKSVDQMQSEFMDYGLFDKGLRIKDFPTDEEILFASYAPGCYCGDSLILFQRDGKLFVNEAAHCSCYGLENQWSPDEILPEQLFSHTPEEYSDHGDEAKAAWSALVEHFNGPTQ